VKNTNHKQKIKRRETNTLRNVYSIRSNLSYSVREIDLFNSLSMRFYKEIQKGYKKFVSRNSQRTSLNFYHFFPISPMNKTLNDFH